MAVLLVREREGERGQDKVESKRDRIANYNTSWILKINKQTIWTCRLDSYWFDLVHHLLHQMIYNNILNMDVFEENKGFDVQYVIGM